MPEQNQLTVEQLINVNARQAHFIPPVQSFEEAKERMKEILEMTHDWFIHRSEKVTDRKQIQSLADLVGCTDKVDCALVFNEPPGSAFQYVTFYFEGKRVSRYKDIDDTYQKFPDVPDSQLPVFDYACTGKEEWL
jgi:hypothetical protein